MQYQTFARVTRFAILLFFLSVLAASPVYARSLSDDVVKAMDQANACRTMSALESYQDCFQETAANLMLAIKSSSSISLHRFPLSKRRTINENIQKKIKSNNKHCEQEQPYYGDSPTGQRRLPYCVYENMLEILINVERNISIYSK